MENASLESPSHYVETLLERANEWHKHFHAHRLENLRKQAKELLEQFSRGDKSSMERFAAHHPNYPKEKICLADAQSVIARERGFSSWPKMKSAMEQITVLEEIERIHKKLREDGKEQFLSIFTEESLKRAILKGIQSWEAAPTDHQKWEGSWDYWQSVVKPILIDAVENDIWSEKSTVDIYYEQTDDQGVTYEGLGASLEMRTPGARYPGFSLAILDLWYGRF